MSSNSGESNSQVVPEGEVFARSYARPTEPLRESRKVRVRLGHAFEEALDGGRMGVSFAVYLQKHFAIEAVLDSGPMGSWFPVHEFARTIELLDLLSSITGMYRFLTEFKRGDQPKKWRDKVAGIFEEEFFGYRVDAKCGVHPLLDSEYERVRFASIESLAHPTLAAVAREFERAHDFSTVGPEATKDVVTCAFSALETLAMIMSANKISALGAGDVPKYLTPALLDGVVDKDEQDAIRQFSEGLKGAINAGQIYRHGKAKPEPHRPSTEFALAYLGSIGTYVRLLARAYVRKLKRST